MRGIQDNCGIFQTVILNYLIYYVHKNFIQMTNIEDQTLSLKLKIFESQSYSKFDNTSDQKIISWMINSCLKTKLSIICRIDIMNIMARRLESQGKSNIFGQIEHVITLIKNCNELYDMAFVIKKYLQVTKKRQVDNEDLIKNIYQIFISMFENQKDISNHLHIQNLTLYMSIKQAYPKQDIAVFTTYMQNCYAIQCTDIYQYIIKLLFQKKNLQRNYNHLVGLTYWLIIMNQPEIIYDLGKKISNFLLYDRSQNSIRMINVCNIIFDILTVKFQKNTELRYANLAALLMRLEDVKLNVFLQIWLQSRIKVIDSLDFQNMLKVTANMGASNTVLIILETLWRCLRKLKKFNILLNIFTNFIRQEYLTISLKDSEEIINYLKIIRAFMIGLCNSQRFQGEEIDILTNNICMHSLKRGISLNLTYRLIIQIYSVYQNRFSSLSQKSKRFFYEIQVLSKIKLQVAQIHSLYNDYMIREINLDDQDGDHYQYLNRKVSKRYRGLENLFNTCYINSLIQALFMTKKFKNQIMKISDKGNIPSRKALFYSLAYLFEELNKKSVQDLEPIRPDYFKLQLPATFRNTTEQQDVAEFFRIFLDAISKELEGEAESYQKIQRLLMQKFKKTITCLECKNTKTQQQNIFDIILRFQKQENILYVSKLIQQNFISQKLVGENQIECYQCNKKTDSISQIVPQKCSDILIFTLSLFEYVGQGKKMLNYLQFQFNLNLGVLMNNQDLGEYQLYAFIVHIGNISTAGHYVTYARNLEENPTIWFHFNDGLVEEVEISKPQQFGFGINETPYMLFYSKKKSGMSLSRLKI